MRLESNNWTFLGDTHYITLAYLSTKSSILSTGYQGRSPVSRLAKKVKKLSLILMPVSTPNHSLSSAKRKLKPNPQLAQYLKQTKNLQNLTFKCVKMI